MIKSLRSRLSSWHLSAFLVGLHCLGSSAFETRARPHLDTTLGYNVLLTDKDTLMRGVGLSFDGGDPYGSLPVNLPSQASLNALAADYGLNTVHLYLEGDAGQNPDPVGINRDVSDAMVRRTALAGLYLIITIGNNGENGAIHSMQKVLDFWDLYGPRYADETHVLYEAHNEPVGYTANHWGKEDWDRQVTIYHAIRSGAPRTFILLGSFMSFNGPDAAIRGADYLASRGVDWGNAGFAFHGYTDLGSMEDAIAPFKGSTSYPALLCTEFWPGDTMNGYNNALESHFIGWMQFEWLSANDVDLTGFRYKIDQAGTVWTPDVAGCRWPASGSPAIPSRGASIGLFDREAGMFVVADPAEGYELRANLATYSGGSNDTFIVERAGNRRVHLMTSHGRYAGTGGVEDPLTADKIRAGPEETFAWIELPDGDIALRAYGGGGHLLTAGADGRHDGRILPSGDDSKIARYVLVEGGIPTGSPPPPTPASKPDPGPFPGKAHIIPGVIVAADFDHGGEGVAYHDREAENLGGVYRPDEGVDIQGSSEGGPNVGWLERDEWMEYAVDVAVAGDYALDVRVASGGTGGAFHVEFDGVDKTGRLHVPGTGGWQTWTNVSGRVTLDAGAQAMRFVSDTGGVNILQFSFTETPTAPASAALFPLTADP